jgi:hypothetical protein
MNIEINVPSNLNEITLGQYQKFLSILDKNEEGPFLNAKTVEIFCGIPLSDVYTIKATSIDKVITILGEVLNTQPEFQDRFMFKGEEYGFIPNLDDMTLGEYVDIDGNVSDWDNMHVVMNVLFRRVKQSKNNLYNIEDYDTSNPAKMKDMPLGVALGAIFFFYALGTELSVYTIHSSIKNQDKETTAELQTSRLNGEDGINQFIVSLKEMLDDLKISLN